LSAALLLTSAPLHAQTTVNELNEAAWAALRAGRHDRASALFAEALTKRPDEPVLLLGAGASAQALGKPRDAIALLQRALKGDPRLTIASRLLGQIAYGEGDVALAIRTYEEALEFAPGDASLVSGLNEWRRDAQIHRRFEERRFDRFRVLFEGRADESLAVRATAVLDAGFRRIGSALGAYPSDSITAILYTEQQFRDITRAPEWSDGQYDGRIRVPAAGAALEPERFERVLTHELTHAMIAAVAPRGVPAWLNEGLAQHFEGADPQAARRRVRASGRRIPLTRLEHTFGHLPAADAQLAYDESLLAVQVMLDRPGFGWTRLLRTLADGQPFERAIGSFGFSYADLEQAFAQ
jgi:tetratricopeptide (TPR) repeat protein